MTCTGVAVTPVDVFTSPRNQAASAPGGAIQTTGTMAQSSWISGCQTGSMKWTPAMETGPNSAEPHCIRARFVAESSRQARATGEKMAHTVLEQCEIAHPGLILERIGETKVRVPCRSQRPSDGAGHPG